MEAIKKIFQLKKNETSLPLFNDTEEAREQVRITYYQSGYGASTRASGNEVTFGVGLKNLYNSFENLCRKQLNEQDRLKQPYKEEQEKQRTELKKRETALTIYDEQKNVLIQNIDDRKFEMIDVKQNPET